MAKIIKKDAENVTVGLDNGTFEVYPLSCCQGFTPEAGMIVDVFKNGDAVVISKAAAPAAAPADNTQVVPHQVNKIAYVLLCFFFGGIGIHKFYAGHWILGLLYLIFCWTFIPALIAFIEFIIGIIKPADNNGNYIA